MQHGQHAFAKGMALDAVKGGPLLGLWIWLASVGWYSLFSTLGALVGLLYGLVLLYDKLAQWGVVPAPKDLFKRKPKEP